MQNYRLHSHSVFLFTLSGIVCVFRHALRLLLPALALALSHALTQTRLEPEERKISLSQSDTPLIDNLVIREFVNGPPFPFLKQKSLFLKELWSRTANCSRTLPKIGLSVTNSLFVVSFFLRWRTPILITELSEW